MDFGHNQDPKKAIEATRAEFKSKMTKEEFELQKENWTRYQIAYNDTRPEFLYAMLKSSLDGDLYLTVKAELDELGGRMEQQDINRLLKRIETIAVQFVPNDEYLKAFENVKQDEVEKVDAYLGRLQTEARKVEIKKPGKCTGHPTCKLTNVTGPCTGAKLWEQAIELNKTEQWNQYVHDSVRLRSKSNSRTIPCPPCCKEVDDKHRKEWMVKKIFIQNMRIKNMKNQLQYRLSAEFSQQGGREKFDMLNYSIEYLLEVAKHAIPCITMLYHAIPCIINNYWRSVPLPCGQ